MTKKIFRSILIASSAVLLASLVIVMGCLYDYFGVVQEYQLKDELRLAAYAVEENGRDYFDKLTARDYRYQWEPDYRQTTPKGWKTTPTALRSGRRLLQERAAACVIPLR